jgi:hypothetical protein
LGFGSAACGIWSRRTRTSGEWCGFDIRYQPSARLPTSAIPGRTLARELRAPATYGSGGVFDLKLLKHACGNRCRNFKSAH